MGHTAGATGQQRMLTPPRNLIPPPVFPGLRVSPFVYWLVIPTWISRPITLRYNCILAISYGKWLTFNGIWINGESLCYFLPRDLNENIISFNVKLIRYQFWCTRCVFRLLKSPQWYSGRKSWKTKNNCENCKRAEKPQMLSHEIEPNPSKDRAMHEGDNPLFWDEFIKFTFFLTVLFTFLFLSKHRGT
jgi:hypothetical protein